MGFKNTPVVLVEFLGIVRIVPFIYRNFNLVEAAAKAFDCICYLSIDPLLMCQGCHIFHIFSSQPHLQITASNHMIGAASKRHNGDAREMIANDMTHSLQEPTWRSRCHHNAELPTNDGIQPQCHRPPH